MAKNNDNPPNFIIVVIFMLIATTLGFWYSDYIWKQIRPVYSKPFWQKEIDL